MLQFDQLTCLVSRPVASSVALRQAAHLAATAETEADAGPTLHVVAVEPPDQSAVADAVRDQVASAEAGMTVVARALPVPDGPGGRLRAIQRLVAELNTDLLILEPPTDRGAVPPLSDEEGRVLPEQLPCPLFLVEEAGSPSSIDHILVPTDLSDESVRTLRHATELAAGYDASVVLLHVIDTSPYVALTPVDRLSLGSTTLTEHRAHRRLQQFLEEGRPPDVPIRTRIVFGEPADRIAHVVSEQAVDLLVLASHGAGAEPEPSLGPVADRVLRRAACPSVLVQAGNRSLLPARSTSNSELDA